MEYCSINEAWGKNRISNQYNKNIEHFKPNDDDLNLYSLNSENNKTPENRLTYKKNFKKNKRKYSSITTDGSDKHITDSDFGPTTDTYTLSSIISKKCSKLLRHIKNCKKCQKKLRKKFRPRLVEKLEYLLEDYREVIVLILLGISLLIFINLVLNVVNNRKT